MSRESQTWVGTSSEVGSIHEKPKAVRQGKKGSCYRCLKGNQFTEKEVCLVCGAKYCSNCVLRAMGSMPEGRKCVSCIGFGVDDSKRGILGKCSRMLKRLLTEMEVTQIMRSEILCKANQLPAGCVFVNGEPLSQKLLVILQSCPNPPKKLNPGCYWYDKLSGFWGKIGQRPCQIISPMLTVGGQIVGNASNGKTNVLITNWRITKRELWMLQLAGVQCEGQLHLWVSADGSYHEEGMTTIKGCLWDKSIIKLVCALLSLPIPPDSLNPCGGEVIGVNYCEQRKLSKLLLLGEQKSGTSTIYKQIEDKTMYTIGPRLKAFSDWLLKAMASGYLEAIFPAVACEYAPLIEELWRDPGFQATYNRKNELDTLTMVGSFFLERAVEISKTDYEPSDLDILYAEGPTLTNVLSCMEYSFPEPTEVSSIDSSNQNDPLCRCQLIRVDPRSLMESCRWLEMFEDVDIVLFCVSLASYDEFFEDSKGFVTNKMLASRQLFENIVIHPTFNQKNFLLLLNKYDMLEEKIEQVPLSRCEWFYDFNPVVHRIAFKQSLSQCAGHYIALKFKRLFDSLTGRKLFVSLVTALEPESVAEALEYAQLP